MAKKDPFFNAEGTLARNPEETRNEANTWRVVMSYAWAICRCATKKRWGVWREVGDKAREWGQDFVQSFNPPYLNIVLPACDNVNGGQNRLVHHLTGLWETVKNIEDADQLKQQLASLQKHCSASEVRLTIPLPPHADRRRTRKAARKAGKLDQSPQPRVYL